MAQNQAAFAVKPTAKGTPWSHHTGALAVSRPSNIHNRRTPWPYHVAIGQDQAALAVGYKGRPRGRPLDAHLPGLSVVGVNLGHKHCRHEKAQRGWSCVHTHEATCP